jgi:hypothetical protein
MRAGHCVPRSRSNNFISLRVHAAPKTTRWLRLWVLLRTQCAFIYFKSLLRDEIPLSVLFWCVCAEMKKALLHVADLNSNGRTAPLSDAQHIYKTKLLFVSVDVCRWKK